MKASLKNYRHAPRKVRIVADAIRGARVSDALVTLTFLPKKASLPLRKLVLSAVANAKQEDPGVSEASLRIQTITVDKGITYVRFMPRAMGRAAPINRECSHVRLALARIEPGTGEEVSSPSRKNSVAK